MSDYDERKLKVEIERLAVDKLRAQNEAQRLSVEREKLTLDREKLVYEANRPVTEAVFKFADMAVRSLLILSGGAALALIAFAGSSKLGTEGKAAAFAPAIGAFGLAAGFAVLVAGMAYLSQLAYNDAAAEKQGNRRRATAIVMWFVSLALYFVGLVSAARSFI